MQGQQTIHMADRFGCARTAQRLTEATDLVQQIEPSPQGAAKIAKAIVGAMRGNGGCLLAGCLLPKSGRLSDKRFELSQNFVQSVENASRVPLRMIAPCAGRFGRPTRFRNLTDLDPRACGEAVSLALERERKSGARLLTGHRDGDYGARALVEDVMAQNRVPVGDQPVLAPDRVEFSPADVAPQYSGHEVKSSASPSSASRFSSRALRCADSRAKRVRARRRSLSANADSMAWLRFRNRCRATSSSTRSTNSASRVTATFVLGMAVG